jgi:hypothetical protein
LVERLFAEQSALPSLLEARGRSSVGLDGSLLAGTCDRPLEEEIASLVLEGHFCAMNVEIKLDALLPLGNLANRQIRPPA